MPSVVSGQALLAQPAPDGRKTAHRNWEPLTRAGFERGLAE
jgi:hypothetical protein